MIEWTGLGINCNISSSNEKTSLNEKDSGSRPIVSAKSVRLSGSFESGVKIPSSSAIFQIYVNFSIQFEWNNDKKQIKIWYQILKYIQIIKLKRNIQEI